MQPRLRRLLDFFTAQSAPTLQVQLFRLACLTTAFLCLVVIGPVNFLYAVPRGVHGANVALGLVAIACLVASARDRHFFAGFFVVFLLVLNPVWFLGAGSLGSVSFYFFPVLLYPLLVFRGPQRWLLSSVLVLDLCGLFVVERIYPALAVPFAQPTDRVFDLVTGVFCSMVGVAVLAGLIVAAYEREQQRITRYAAALAAGEENYRAIFNSTSEALFIYAEDGHLIDVNTSMCDMFRTNRETVLSQTINDRSLGVSPYSQVEAEQKMKLALSQGTQVFRWRSRRADGQLFWSEVSLRATEIASQRRFIAAVRDITARITAEDALRTQEERLRLALGASNQGWFDLNLITGEGTASGEYARIIGLEPVEFKVNAQAWQEGIHPDDRPLILREFQACIVEGGTRTMEYRRRTTTGEWKWIRSTGKIVERDPQGRALRMTGTHADITDRKNLEAQLLHSQRLESIGTLAGGVAHDLNNVLTPLLMIGTMLKDKLPDAADQVLLRQIESGAKRGAAIVRQLLTFSRDAPQSRVAVNVNKQVDEIMEIMRGTFPREIRTQARVPSDLWPLMADPIQLHQVLLNLCINARDAMPDGGTLVIAAENVAPEPNPGAGSAVAQRAVKITVSDTGHGIPRENLERIFDPFFTTKGVGKGTGLGLSTVHGIVKSHGGTISVVSEPGGTHFFVVLPASDAPPAPILPAVQPQAPALQRRPVVLVVDDEDFVLATTLRILEHAGFKTLGANGGEEALRCLRAQSAPIDLVVTDVMMPGMDGPTLAPLLREIQPHLKIIGVSGLAFEGKETRAGTRGFDDVLRKPYDLTTLVTAVRRLVAS